MIVVLNLFQDIFVAIIIHMNEEDEKFDGLTPKDRDMIEVKPENSPQKGELVQFPDRGAEKAKGTFTDRFFNQKPVGI